jgi:hypothetical protein
MNNSKKDKNSFFPPKKTFKRIEKFEKSRA